MSIDEHRAQIDEMLADLGAPEGASGLEFDEDETEILRAARDEKRAETPDEEIEAAEEPEEKPKATRARLRSDIRAQIAQAETLEDPKAEEEDLGEFDLNAWAEQVQKDPEAAFKTVTERVLGMKEAGKRIRESLSRFEQAEKVRQLEAAQDFIDATPDYPHDDEEINNFMEAGLAKLKLPYTKRSLQRVWELAKKEGYIEGLATEEPTEEPKKAPKAAAKPVKAAPRKAPPRARGRGTGAAAGAEDFGSKLTKLIEDTDNIEEIEEKLRNAGLMSEGSLSKLTGAFTD